MSSNQQAVPRNISRIALGLSLCACVACTDELGPIHGPRFPNGHDDLGGGTEADDEGDSADAGDPFTVTVVESFNAAMPVAGISVEVIDDVTGLPVEPLNAGKSNAQGKVKLPVAPGTRYGVRAYADETYIDTYSFHHIGGEADTLIRVVSRSAASLLPLLTEHTVRPDRAPIIGHVLWKTPEMSFYDVVGCAHLEDAAADILSEDLRYFDSTLPASPQAWPLERGTRPGDGRFYVANSLPGLRTLNARMADGTLIGSMQLPVFARQDSGTTIDGVAQSAFLSDIVIDAPRGARNPTPADCEE